MRLIPLHNVLYAATQTLGADAAALKLLPLGAANWAPCALMLGDTAQIQTLGWRDDASQPTPNDPATPRTLFGIDNALTLYQSPDNRRIQVKVDLSEALLNAMPGQFINHQRRGVSSTTFASLWIVFTFDEPPARFQTMLQALAYENGANSSAEMLLGVAAQSLWGLYQSTQAHADPITGLPGAADFHERLRRTCRRSANGSPLVLLLMKLDNYLHRRRRFGHEHTDRWLQQAASVLEATLRKEDGLFRFGDAQFAVVANVADAQGADKLANKLLEASRTLSDATEFATDSLSIGYIYHGPEEGSEEDPQETEQQQLEQEPDPQRLNLSAEQALDQAALLGGNQALAFSGTFDTDTASMSHPQGSMLTADPAKDYRNSHILWHTISLVAAKAEPNALCRAFINLLEESLSDTNVALLTEVHGNLRSLAQLDDEEDDLITPLRQQFIRQALAQQKSQVQTNAGNSSDQQQYWLATPLMYHGNLHGALFIESNEALDAADQVFFKALADQIAGVLDRAQLVAIERQRSAQESKALRAELHQLKQQNNTPVIAQVVQSDAMRQVMDHVHRIAATDVSVLILGESGAGKEVMAHSIHQASDRADRPLVIVDCSAIAHSLIDSELFGRVKGAFTGADAASTGRIAQANGGTLFLDEIGELPLDVQAKLLRFVQEKQIIAVGDTAEQHIDTRIICATNRNLLHEVREGKFRGDLYYRLQVIQVHLPSLRERRADLPVLVQNLLAKFNQQFGREITGLTDAAWAKVNEYNWPGNIRELQNAMLRGTLMAEGSELEAKDIQVDQQDQEAPAAKQTLAADVAPSTDALAPPAPIRAPARLPTDSFESEDDSWSMLATILRGQIQALDNNQLSDAPLGRWLADAVVLNAYELSNQVVRSAARLLGMPETTLRRQLGKAKSNASNPFQSTSARWLASLPALTSVLHTILTEPSNTEGSLAERCQVVLLEEVAQATSGDLRSGAAIMGVTPPTYTRWLERHQVAAPSAPIRVSY